MGNQKMKVCFAFLFVFNFSLGRECGTNTCAAFGECCNEWNECVPSSVPGAPSSNCPQVCNKNTGKMCDFGLCCKNNNQCGECQRSFRECPCPVTTGVFINGTCCKDRNQCAECDPGPWMKNNGSVSPHISSPPPPSTEDCPKGWELQGDFCYKHIGDKKTWDMAWYWCQDKENAHLASILSKEDNCFVFNLTTGSHKGNTEKFWLDGIFLTEFKPNTTSTSELGEKFIWTDGSKMDYKNWNKISRARNCSQGDDCPPGEPQQSDTNLCLHGGVSEIRAPVPQREVATDDHCTTWGNQESCTKKLPFVCKRAKGQKFDDSINRGSRF